MLKSSLLEILRTFSKQELIKFEDFVRSPYFNKKENVLNLFLEIKRYAPGFGNENLEKEKTWLKLFPGKSYNYGIMKNLIHDLGKLCESFLSEEVYKNNEMQRSYDFLHSIFSRNIPNIFQNKIESSERTFSKNFSSGIYESTADYYEKNRNLYDLKSNFFFYNPKLKKGDELLYVSENLLFGFLIRCFTNFQKIMVSNLEFNLNPEKNILYLFLKDLDENSILNSIVKYSESQSRKNYPVLKCYYSMYKAFKNNQSTEYYYKYKKDISESLSFFSEDEARNLYRSLLTCLTNLKITTKDFYSEYFSVIQLGFKGKVILNNDGTITWQVFLSIVNVSLGANEIDYAENFINNYKDKLPADIRDCIYLFSSAKLNFIKKNFESSLEFLSKIQNEQLFLKYDIKNLQLSIYYEFNDRVAFDYSYDSFKHFIRKNKLTNESRVITMVKYSEYIKLLFKIRESSDTYELSKLKKELTENKVANKLWFMEKIEEMEKS